MSFGRKKSKESSSQTALDYGTDIWGPQAPYLQDLYAKARGSVGAGDQGAGGYLGNLAYGMNQAGADATRQAGQAQQAGMGLLGGVNAGQGVNQAMQNLGGYGTQGYNPFASQAVQAAGQQLGQQYREQFLPQLQGQAIQAGGLGGSRQQIGAALGADRAMQNLGNYATQVGLQGYEGQMARQQQALQSQAQLAGQTYGQQAGLAQGLYGTGAGLQGQLAGQQAGLAPQYAEFMRSAPWYGLAQYGSLLGSPVMSDVGGTTTGTTTGKSSGFNLGF
jgi:hypothetical protein